MGGVISSLCHHSAQAAPHWGERFAGIIGQSWFVGWFETLKETGHMRGAACRLVWGRLTIPMIGNRPGIGSSSGGRSRSRRRRRRRLGRPAGGGRGMLLVAVARGGLGEPRLGRPYNQPAPLRLEQGQRTCTHTQRVIRKARPRARPMFKHRKAGLHHANQVSTGHACGEVWPCQPVFVCQ